MPACPIPPGSNCVAYLRDSGGTDQDLSVPEQTAAIQRYCAEHHLNLVHVYQDVATPGSSTIGRANFIQMIDDLRASAIQAQALIVWSFSRFSRDIDDSQYFKADLRRRGYTIHSMTDPVIEGLDGRLIEAALEWSNAKFLDTLSTDVRRGLYHLVETYGAVPGTPPRGFIRTPIDLGRRRDGDTHIVHRWDPDPELAPLVLQAYQMRAAGAPYSAITQATHLYTKKTGWNHFFENPLYKGELRFGSLVIPNYCQPIVPPALWDQVQANNTRPSRQNMTRKPRHPRRSTSSYLLSGLLYCPCGTIMNGETIRTSSGYSSRYYICYQKKQPRGGEGCTTRRIPMQAVEQAVINDITTNVLTVTGLRRLSDATLENLFDQRTTLTAQRNDLVARRNDTAQQINRITDAIAHSGHSKALLDRLRALETDAFEQDKQITVLDAQLAELAKRPTDEQLEAIIAQLLPAIQSNDRNEVRSAVQRIVIRATAERIGGDVQVLIDYADLTSMGRCPHGDTSHRRKITSPARC